MNYVDLIVLVLVALAAVRGLRLGAVTQVAGFGGLFLGFYLGALLGKELSHLVNSKELQNLVVLSTVIGLSLLFGGLGRAAGARLLFILRQFHLGVADSFLGVVVGVLVALLSIWIAVGLLLDSRFVSLDQEIQRSRIVAAIDRVLPPLPPVFSQVANFFSDQDLSQGLAQLTFDTATPVPLPSAAAVFNVAARAQESTVQVAGDGCGQIQEGSGFVVAPGLVVTNAHVVAGITHPMVNDPGGHSHTTVVVLFDPEFDLAVLRVNGLTTPALPIDSSMVGRDAQAVILGYPGGGPLRVGPAGVMAAEPAQSENIYGQGRIVREVYELDANVRPGNSGGPLVSMNGEVIGVVFSRSATNPQIGYALATPSVVSRLRTAERDVEPVGTGGCTSE